MGEIGRWVLEQSLPTSGELARALHSCGQSLAGRIPPQRLTDVSPNTLDSAGLSPDAWSWKSTDVGIARAHANNLDTLHTLEVMGIRDSRSMTSDAIFVTWRT